MLRLRRFPVDTYNEAVAYLPRRSAIYRPEEFQALAKVEIVGHGRRIVAVVNVIDHPDLLAPDQVALSEQGFAKLGLPEGSEVELVHAPPPESLEAVRRKINGEELSADELSAIVSDIANFNYSKMDIAAFLVASASSMSAGETLYLTRAMASIGTQLKWPDGLVVDKHCIGGIPGNRTSMIIVPIVAAHELAIPKTSSRAITSPAGTADTMEVMARVNLEIDEIRELIRAEKGCLVWGGHVNLSPADDILISVERPLRIGTPELMVASILSKNAAAGSSCLVVDIPVGPTAKIRHQDGAVRLRKLFEFVGERLGMNVSVSFSDGSQPVGRGIGPVLEARDVLKVLRCETDAPADLRERALRLAGQVLEFDPALYGGRGYARARELLDSGAALAKMERIQKLQGPPPVAAVLGSLQHDVPADRDGVVAAIDCYAIARIARLAGAPNDKGAGIDLLKKVGDRVEQGEPLYRVHAGLPIDFKFAVDRARQDNAYRLGATIQQ